MLLIPLIGALLAFLLGNKGSRAITLIITTLELGLAGLLILGTSSLGSDPGGMSHSITYMLARLGTDSALLLLNFLDLKPPLLSSSL